MTREEAIKVLNMVEAHGSLVIQAKEMAIKALEQGPKQSISCDASDCIYCIYDPDVDDWKCERVHINIDVDCICGNWEEDIEDEELDGDLEDQFEKILEDIDAGRR